MRLLWYANFWDHPRSGALEWQGRRYWFDEVEPGIGVFNVMELSASEPCRVRRCSGAAQPVPGDYTIWG